MKGASQRPSEIGSSSEDGPRAPGMKGAAAVGVVGVASVESTGADRDATGGRGHTQEGESGAGTGALEGGLNP